MPFSKIIDASELSVSEGLLKRWEAETKETVVCVRTCASTGVDVSLAYHTFGKESDPCVLLVMGLNSQAVAWDNDFCAALAARGYFVVRYDNRDVGLSTKFDAHGRPSILKYMLPKKLWLHDPIPYTLSDMAADGIALLDKLSVKTAHVVGVSMGGMIGQLMAIEHPERVATLTSIMSNVGSSTQENPSLLTKLFFLRKPKNPNHAEDVAAFRAWWITKMGGQRDLDMNRMFTVALFGARRSLYRDGLFRHTAAIMRSAPRVEALKRLSLPALVVHGDCDRLVPTANGYETARVLRNARFVLRPGMGHFILPEDFDWLAGEIDDLVHRAARQQSHY